MRIVELFLNDFVEQERSRGRFTRIKRFFRRGRAAIRVPSGRIDLFGQRGTALTRAAASGYLLIVQTLLNAGASVNAKDQQGRTALHEAACRGSQRVVRLLLDTGASVEAVDNAGHTALFYTPNAGVDAPSVARMLICAGADPNEAFPLAFKGQKLELVRCLLTHGANSNVDIGEGTTALMYAAKRGLASLVFRLLEAGAHVRPICLEDKAALTLAAQRGFDDVVGLIANADKEFIDLVDGRGCIALYYATLRKHSVVVKKLLAAGANPNAFVHPLNAFDWRSGKADLLCMLLENGANADALRENDTPLFRATRYGRDDLAGLLLAHGTDPDITDSEGQISALHIAVEDQLLELVKVLARAGAAFTLRDDEGRTALEEALRAESYDIAQELISRGAQLSGTRWKCNHYSRIPCLKRLESFQCALQKRYEALLSLLEQERGLPKSISELILKGFSGEDWAILRLLFGHGTSDGINVALHRAAHMGCVFLIKRLLLEGLILTGCMCASRLNVSNRP